PLVPGRPGELHAETALEATSVRDLGERVDLRLLRHVRHTVEAAEERPRERDRAEENRCERGQTDKSKAAPQPGDGAAGLGLVSESDEARRRAVTRDDGLEVCERASVDPHAPLTQADTAETGRPERDLIVACEHEAIALSERHTSPDQAQKVCGRG